MSTPEKNDDEFKFDLLASGPAKSYAKPLGILGAVVGVVFILATMATNIAETMLPMNDAYLDALVPTAPDGREALSLQTLEHEITDNTMTVRGTIGNRTEYSLKDLRAVVEMQDRFAIPHTIEAPIDPPELAVQGTASFTATQTLEHGPGGYVIRFRIADGPFVPHKDDRTATYAPPTIPGK